MFGRDREIENLVTKILEAKRSRLAILGPGGIGKTSLHFLSSTIAEHIPVLVMTASSCHVKLQHVPIMSFLI